MNELAFTPRRADMATVIGFDADAGTVDTLTHDDIPLLIHGSPAPLAVGASVLLLADGSTATAVAVDWTALDANSADVRDVVVVEDDSPEWLLARLDQPLPHPSTW